MIDVNSVTQEEIQKALQLLAKQKEQRSKQAERVKNDPEAKAKAAARALRLRVKSTLLVKKAVAAGISVSDAEIDAHIADGAEE